MNKWKPRRVGRERRETGKYAFFRVLSGLRGDGTGRRGTGLGRRGEIVFGEMRLTSCAPLACITLIEWRTSADAIGR